MFDRTPAAPAPFAGGFGLHAPLAALVAGLRRRAERSRKAAAERASAFQLLAMDAHLLDDIGLTRAQLQRSLDGVGSDA